MEAERKKKEVKPDNSLKIGTSGMDMYLSPVSFWRPEHLNESAWIGHAPFAFWLMEALRPRTFVELGTHGGYSYFAFCQAVDDLKLETRCYAVDTWKGDEHAGFYGEEVFKRVQDYNERHYVAFSRLVRSTFDEASGHFSNGSIDLLHIDGRHFYEDVKHDFESWRPKLSERAVVLFHDTNVRERDFGVFRLWEELQAEFPTFEFLHCHGLGVLGYGSDLSEGIKAFFAATANSRVATEVRGAYGRLGAALRADFDHRQTFSAHQAHIVNRDAQIANLNQGLAERDGQIANLNQGLAERDGQIANLNQGLAERDGQIANLNQGLAERDGQIAAILGWRLTRPMRLLGKLLRWTRRWFQFSSRAGLFAPKRFDAEWYLKQNPDVAASGMQPYKHYIRFGVREGRRPAPDESLCQGGQPDALSDKLGSLPRELKEVLTSLYRVELRSFLATGLPLQLPSSDNPEISIILVLFNRAELTLRCLRSIAEIREPSVEILIVDNASSDETPALLNLLNGQRIIRNQENRNFLLAVNQAAREARGEHILLLNNDTQLMPGTLHAALATLRSSPDIGAVGGRLILLDGSLQEAGSIIWRDGSCLGYGRGDNPFAPMYMFRRDVDYCSGAFLLTPRVLWERLGGFDETFKPAYYEETDYCARLWERGLRVVYEPKAALLHYEFASSSSVKSAIGLQQNHQRVFAKRHQELLSRLHVPDPGAILDARMTGNKKRILFIDDRVPHAWLGSGYPRARAILTTLIEHGFFVTLYPLTKFDEDWPAVYSDMPPELEVMTGYGPSLLRSFLGNRRGYYETILVSRPHNMNILKPVLAEHPDWFEKTDILYDAEALFVSRDIAFRKLIGAPMPEKKVEAITREEIALAAAADAVISVSESDRRVFEKYGIERVHVLGHAIRPAATPKPFSERCGFLFVGAIHHESSPNGDSMIWFLKEVFPKIRSHLGESIHFTIAGVAGSERVRELAGPGVHITGPLSDLTELYDSSRVFVAPTRYAAGIPLKVYEAAAYGVPTVTTTLIAEQLGWKSGEELLAADGQDPVGFAQQCIRLFQSQELWERIRENALVRIQRDCSEEQFARTLRQALKPCWSKDKPNLGVEDNPDRGVRVSGTRM